MISMMIFAAIVLGILVAIIPQIAWLLVFLISKVFHFSCSYASFGYTSVGLVVFAWAILAYGFFFGRFTLDINSVKYANKDLPEAFNGYRIVHISDLHLSTFDDNHQKLQDFVDSINAQNPDAICFTGDLVSLGVEEVLPCKEILKNLHARDGIFSVLGNHDFLIYSRKFNSATEREEAVEQLARFEREELGWNLLRNQNCVITRNGETLTFVGVDNQNCANQGFKTIARGRLQDALQGTDGFRILLSHDPSHWQGEVLPQTDIPLTLSGHTHAAQIKLFGWTPAKWSFIETDGMYEKDGQNLYVNVGLGCTMPVRLGANAEITVITLHR
ncbi:MAG: metallophosphoesterase [Bacteroidales bacterium]|nr:metallophosphoesterase [Bacteroidales bacterium]